jgi:hypothetical protein
MTIPLAPCSRVLTKPETLAGQLLSDKQADPAFYMSGPFVSISSLLLDAQDSSSCTFSSSGFSARKSANIAGKSTSNDRLTPDSSSDVSTPPTPPHFRCISSFMAGSDSPRRANCISSYIRVRVAFSEIAAGFICPSLAPGGRQLLAK